jgi:hypothetical protein
LSREITPVKFFKPLIDRDFFAVATRIVFVFASQHPEEQQGRGVLHPASTVDPIRFLFKRFVLSRLLRHHERSEVTKGSATSEIVAPIGLLRFARKDSRILRERQRVSPVQFTLPFTTP